MNREEILAAVLSLFRSHFQRDDSTGSMTAARAGLLLKRAYPDALNEGGFAKFADLLHELEKNGDIRTGRDSKNVLAIWLPQPHPLNPRFQPLRADVWRAFTTRRPEGSRFFNRTTGVLRLGVDVRPLPWEQWAKIDQLSDEIQKQWAVDFLTSEDISDVETLRSLSLDPWYYHFAVAMTKLHPEIARRWNRSRSERVIVHVTDWCFANGILPAAVFETGQDLASGSAPVSVVHSDSDQAEAIDSETGLRQTILAALSSMSTSDLLDLPIPARILLEVSKRRLSSEG